MCDWLFYVCCSVKSDDRERWKMMMERDEMSQEKMQIYDRVDNDKHNMVSHEIAWNLHVQIELIEEANIAINI